MKTVLLIVSPTLSDAENFSKIFLLHPEVVRLPSECISDRKLLSATNWNSANYFIITHTCQSDTQNKNELIKFVDHLYLNDIEVKVAIVSVPKDTLIKEQIATKRNILRAYLRDVKKLSLYNPIFISLEQVKLNQQYYMQSLQNYIKIPTVSDRKKLKMLSF